MSEHSPMTPFDLVRGTEHHGPYLTTRFGTTVCDFYTMSDPSGASVRNGGKSRPIPFTDAEDNAEFLWQAGNSHDALVKALRNARLFAEAMRGHGINNCQQIIDQIDAALRLAKGDQTNG